MAEPGRNDRAYPPNVNEITRLGGDRKNWEGLLRMPPQIADIRNILPFVRKGWTYHTDVGGRLSYLLDTRVQQAEAKTIKIYKGKNHHKLELPYTPNEHPQWLTGISVFFSNPNAVLLTRIGEYQLSVSPLTYDSFFKGNYFFNVAMKCVGASPLTAYGPMFTMAFDPPDAIPIPSDYSIELYICPETCIADEVEVLAWIVSRVIVTDRDDFLNSLQMNSAEMLIGKEQHMWVNNK